MKIHSEWEQKAFGAVRAEQMRAAMTPAEAKLWEALEPLGFKAQVPLQVSRKQSVAGKQLYIMDFYHPGVRICVEVDGGVHRRQGGRDGRRDRALRANGIVTIRVSNSDVTRRFAETMLKIKVWVSDGAAGEEAHRDDGKHPDQSAAAESRG